MGNLNFKKLKTELKKNKYVLMYFWSSWCGSCFEIIDFLEDFEVKNPEIKVLKINTGELPQFLLQYKIVVLPTCIFFEGGVEVERLTTVHDIQKELPTILIKVKK